MSRQRQHPYEPAARALERYIKHAERLGNSSLLRERNLDTRLRAQPVGGGRFRVTFQYPDEALLIGHVAQLRKFLMKKEPVFLGRMLQIGRRSIEEPSLVQELERLRRAWLQAESSGSEYLLLEKAGPVGSGCDRLTPDQMLNLFMNVEFMHADARREDELNDLADVPAVKHLMLQAVSDYTRIVLRVCQVFHAALSGRAVRQLGV